MIWLDIAVIIVAIVLLRWWYYWREVLFVKDIERTYIIFIREDSKLPKQQSKMYLLDPSHPCLKALTKLRKRKRKYVDLVKKAGFYNKGVVSHDYIQDGFGTKGYRVDHKTADLIDNTAPIFRPTVLDSFDNITGYYEQKAYESFDPLFWILLVIQSPKIIAEFLAHFVRGLFATK